MTPDQGEAVTVKQLNAEGRTVAELAGLAPGELAKQWRDEADQAIREAGWQPLRSDDGTETA